MVDVTPNTPPHLRRGLVWSGVAMVMATLTASASAATTSFCIDKGNPFFTIDHAVATAVAHAEHTSAHFTVIDTRVGADALNAQKGIFFAKLATRCDLVMGFPVETGYPTVPAGVMATNPYAATGFVLAAPGSTAPSFASLAPHTKVGITYLTVPSTYFDHGHGATLEAHEYSTPGSLYRALEAKDVAVALMWQPWLVNHLAHTHARVAQHALSLPHAQWQIVALYSAAHAAAGKSFDHALQHLVAHRQLASLVAPYLVPTK
jgi:ABC-type amino acid transport substrate-binding protein